MVGASFDPPEENKAFADAHGFGYRLLSDVDHSTGRIYGVERGPDEPYPDYPKRITFLIAPDGTVAKVYEVTDPSAHPGTVLDDVRSMAGSSGA